MGRSNVRVSCFLYSYKNVSSLLRNETSHSFQTLIPSKHSFQTLIPKTCSKHSFQTLIPNTLIPQKKRHRQKCALGARSITRILHREVKCKIRRRMKVVVLWDPLSQRFSSSSSSDLRFSRRFVRFRAVLLVESSNKWFRNHRLMNVFVLRCLFFF